MKKIVQKVFLSIFCLLFATISLVSLGALGEDYVNFANILNHLLNKTLIIVFVYTAIKLPLIILLKSTLISSCCALLSWKAIIKPDYLKELFSFHRKEVYYIQIKSLAYEVKKLIPLFNKNVGVENKIRFCMNPASIAIAIINCVKEYLVCNIDLLSNHITSYFRKQNIIDTTEQHLSTVISPKFSRFLKGFVVIICELSTLPLKFIQPIANIPYWLLYFVAITLPDFISDIFYSSTIAHNNASAAANIANNLNILTAPSSNIKPLKQHINHVSKSNRNSKYIKEQLEDTPEDDIFY